MRLVSGIIGSAVPPSATLRSRLRSEDLVSDFAVFQNYPLDPEALDCASKGYETARAELGLKDHMDPLTEILAQKVIAVVLKGERNSEQIARRAIETLGISV